MATPCEQAGLHVGDWVRLIEDTELLFKGAILEMIIDDKDEVPFFTLIDGEWTEEAKVAGCPKDNHFCLNMKRVKKLGEF